MPAYMIISARLSDREKFGEYTRAVGPLVSKFGGEYILSTRSGETLEGRNQDGASVVISQWPDRAAALRFWHSTEYTRAKALREGTGEFDVVVTESPDAK